MNIANTGLAALPEGAKVSPSTMPVPHAIARFKRDAAPPLAIEARHHRILPSKKNSKPKPLDDFMRPRHRLIPKATARQNGWNKSFDRGEAHDVIARRTFVYTFPPFPPRVCHATTLAAHAVAA
jgi:hypothetical protein